MLPEGLSVGRVVLWSHCAAVTEAGTGQAVVRQWTAWGGCLRHRESRNRLATGLATPTGSGSSSGLGQKGWGPTLARRLNDIATFLLSRLDMSHQEASGWQVAE